MAFGVLALLDAIVFGAQVLLCLALRVKSINVGWQATFYQSEIVKLHYIYGWLHLPNRKGKLEIYTFHSLDTAPLRVCLKQHRKKRNLSGVFLVTISRRQGKMK